MSGNAALEDETSDEEMKEDRETEETGPAPSEAPECGGKAEAVPEKRTPFKHASLHPVQGRAPIVLTITSA